MTVSCNIHTHWFYLCCCPVLLLVYMYNLLFHMNRCRLSCVRICCFSLLFISLNLFKNKMYFVCFSVESEGRYPFSHFTRQEMYLLGHPHMINSGLLHLWLNFYGCCLRIKVSHKHTIYVRLCLCLSVRHKSVSVKQAKPVTFTLCCVLIQIQILLDCFEAR